MTQWAPAVILNANCTMNNGEFYFMIQLNLRRPPEMLHLQLDGRCCPAISVGDTPTIYQLNRIICSSKRKSLSV